MTRGATAARIIRARAGAVGRQPSAASSYPAPARTPLGRCVRVAVPTERRRHVAADEPRMGQRRRTRSTPRRMAATRRGPIPLGNYRVRFFDDAHRQPVVAVRPDRRSRDADRTDLRRAGGQRHRRLVREAVGASPRGSQGGASECCPDCRTLQCVERCRSRCAFSFVTCVTLPRRLSRSPHAHVRPV